MTNNTLVLFDGLSIAYRYAAVIQKHPSNPFITSTGINTTVPYGIARTVAMILTKMYPTHMAVIWDPPGLTWRHELYPEYKAGRTVPGDDFYEQVNTAYNLLQTWGVYTTAFSPLEADDVIGILAKKAEAEGFDVRIVTKDKDFAQLVSDRVKLLDTGDKLGESAFTHVTRSMVFEKFHVWPEQIPDYLALVGDSADNIPGVKNIGKKIAAELLLEYENIAGIVANADKLGGVKKKLFKDEQVLKRLELDKKLTTIPTNIALPVTLDQLKTPAITQDFIDALNTLELRSVKKLLGV